MDSNHSIIFFDGVCNLCNSAVAFIIERDPDQHFKFASLQSDFASQSLTSRNFHGDKLQSIVLIEDGEIYTESTAALRIAKKLTGFWPAFYVFVVLPKFLRDAVYRFIARNRYRWFGKKDHCMIPTPELKDRFVG